MFEILELLLGLFILLIATGIVLAPLVGFVLLIIYLVAPQLLPFKNNRKNTTYTYNSKKNASQTRRRKTAGTSQTTAAKPKTEKKPAKPKQPSAEIIIAELKKQTDGIMDEELKAECTEMHEHLVKIHELEAESKEITDQMEKMYSNYLPSFINVLSRYERLQYAGNSENLAQYREKVVHTADVIDDALTNILDTAHLKNLDALGRDMKELETALKADGIAGQLQLPKQQ